MSSSPTPTKNPAPKSISPDSVVRTKTLHTIGNPRSSVVDDMGMENVFIGISGLIGAGKTTLATALAKVLNLPVYYEPVADNDYLEDYYKDMKRYSFPLQVYLLNRRFKQHQQIVWAGQGGVQDRTIYEDAVFAKMLCREGHLEERDYRTYISLFNNMSNFMKKPNIIVHLDVSPEESLRRIKMRQRGCESGVKIEFLQALHEAYEEFLHDIARVIPVIKVSYDTFRTAEEMAERIAIEYARIQNIRHVDFKVPRSLTPVVDLLNSGIQQESNKDEDTIITNTRTVNEIPRSAQPVI